MKTALVFPGQGSQAVGMGKALADAFPAAREVFERVDAALGESLSRLIFEGPEAELTLTANAQPALDGDQPRGARALESGPASTSPADAAFVAGHSLGEYSALCAAGALTLEDTARLLAHSRRGDAEGRPGRRGRDGGDPRASISPTWRRSPPQAAASLYLTGGDLRGRQRQWRRTGRDLRHQGRRRAGDGDRQAARARSARCRCRSPRPSIAR